MNDATTALLDRIERLAVSVHLHETNATQLRAERDAAIERADRIEAVARAESKRVEELEEQVRSQTAGLNDLRGALARAVEADAPRRRIDVVTAAQVINWLDANDDSEEALLRWLREPVGGAS